MTQLVEKADRRTAWEFLQHVFEALPYKVHTILPPSHRLQANNCRARDNGIQFAEQPRNRNTASSRQMRFDMICEGETLFDIGSKTMVERMNRTIKNATVKRYHYDSHDQLRTHLADVLAADSFARRLKTLGGLTPYEFICKTWTSEPDRFTLSPIHQMTGLNS